MEITLKTIGVIHTKGSDAEVKEKGDLEGELEVFPQFQDALDGIERVY
jgi:tRNA (Thr-GGU) A37 N-methylase